MNNRLLTGECTVGQITEIFDDTSTPAQVVAYHETPPRLPEHAPAQPIAYNKELVLPDAIAHSTITLHQPAAIFAPQHDRGDPSVKIFGM